jgi:hypothetical protein
MGWVVARRVDVREFLKVAMCAPVVQVRTRVFF